MNLLLIEYLCFGQPILLASEVHIPLARHLSIEDAHGHVCNRLRIIIKLKNSFSHQQTAFDDLLGPEKGLTGRSKLSSFGCDSLNTLVWQDTIRNHDYNSTHFALHLV